MTAYSYICLMKPIKYIARNDADERWGLTVCSVGYQRVEAGEEYPPAYHNSDYLFNVSRGRTLQEYQLLYIVEGGGELVLDGSGRHKISAGDMFMIFPGQWHTYKPDTESGWSEYWIGFRGENIDNRVERGFFSDKRPVYRIGYNKQMEQLYREAIDIASSQPPFFQQLLAGVVNHILGLMFMTMHNNQLTGSQKALPELMTRAKQYIEQAVESDIRMPQIAEKLNISYSAFRHLFKLYTGLSPAHYLADLRIFRAKELLRRSHISIKEISYMLRFDSPEYFTTMFKRKTGLTPSQFRKI